MLKGHSRAIAVASAALASTLGPAAADGNVSVYELIAVVFAVITAVAGVYLQPPNSPSVTPNV